MVFFILPGHHNWIEQWKNHEAFLPPILVIFIDKIPFVKIHPTPGFLLVFYP
jgi:hypothetical protein